jgi:hypothetical protein
MITSMLAVIHNENSTPNGTDSNGADSTVTGPPKAEVKTVIDDYAGQKLSDSYRWLDDGPLPETVHFVEAQIWRTRSISLAWLPDNSGSYHTRYPGTGDVPAGQKVYNRGVFFHKLGSEGNADGLRDAMVFGEGVGPADWPDIQVFNNGKWLMAPVSTRWTKDELYLKDSTAPAKDFVWITTLWVPECGSLDNPTQFDFPYAYSPYYHVKAGIIYPSIFFMTARRVDSMHAKKMTAFASSSLEWSRTPHFIEGR